MTEKFQATAEGPWKVGNEFLPYHPQASHISPDHRDGWNACYRAAMESKAQPKGTAKPCLVTGDCKHGSWCSEVYCQEHCRFVEESKQPQASDEHLMNFLAPWVIADDPKDRADFLAALRAALASQAPAPAPADRLAQALEDLLMYTAENDPGQGDPDRDHPSVTAAMAALTAHRAIPSPAVKADPLTEEQIVNDGLMMCPTKLLDNCADAFEAGVKFAERAHGIGDSHVPVQGSQA